MSDDRVFTKCAWRLVPLMALIYLVNYLDRVNVGFAALTMNRDLGLSPSVYGFAAGILFLSYSLFHIPSSLFLHRIGARRGVFLILVVWGALSASCAFVRGPLSFYFLRFCLGLAESGFIPGMLLYLTYWFPQSYRARHTANFQAAVPLAFIIGGPLSTLILQVDGAGGLHGWQWLFLLEGVPAIGLGIIVLKTLPDRPAEAHFLSPGEKQFIAARLLAEDRSDHGGAFRALLDPRLIALGFAYIAIISALYGVQLWLPQIVRDLGFSTLATGFIVTAPFLVAAPAMMWWGHASDANGERIWHVSLPIIATGAALLAASVAAGWVVTLGMLGIAVIAPLLVIPVFNSLAGLFFGGRAAAAGIAMVLCLGNLGGLAGPFLIGTLKQQTGGYAAGMIALAVGCFLSVIFVLAAGRALIARQAAHAVAMQ